MFPAGAAGYGLLILRLCAAGMLMQALHSEIVSYGSLQFIAVATMFLLLCLGLFTPLCCVASTVGQIAMHLLRTDKSLLVFTLSLSLTVALLLLGPGAFSLDSRLFGRRLLVRAK